METVETPSDALSRFSLSIFSLNGLLMRAGENAAKPFGQTSARWQVLGRAGFQPQTVSQMAREMGNSRQAVQYTADALAKDGLVAYKDNPSDRRAQLVKLTPQGAEVLAAIYARNEEWSQEIMAKIDKEKLLELAKALENVEKIFDTHLNDK